MMLVEPHADGRAREPLAVFALRPVMRPGWGVLAGALPFIALLTFRPGIVVLPLTVAAMLLLVALAHLRRRPLPREPIVVAPGTIRMPSHPRATTATPLAIRDVTSVEERGRGARRAVIIGTRSGFVALPAAAFVDAESAPRLRDAIRTALAAEGDGTALLAAMNERDAAGRRAMARTPRATMGLFAAIALGFAVELATGATDDRTMLLRLGANAPVLVHQGQWWRLLTANLLHAGFLHIYLNAAALLSVGTMLERSLGTSRFLTAALFAGIIGNVASMSSTDHMYSVGASTMLFGLVGALLVVNLLHQSRLPAGFFLGARRWIVLLVLNGAISLLPGIDWRAHLGGLLAGALAMLIFARRLEADGGTASRSGTAAGALAAFYVAGIAAAVLHFTTAKASPASELLTAMVQVEGTSAERRNELAWEIAIDRTSSPQLLERGLELAKRAVSEEPTNGSFIDTQAYLSHRLGRFDEALALEREAAWATNEPAVFTMLGRMLQERHALGRDLTTASIRRQSADVVARGARGAVLYAAVTRGGKLAGLLRVVLPAGADEARAPAPQALGMDATFRVLLVDATSTRPEQPTAETQIAFAPHDAGTLKLP